MGRNISKNWICIWSVIFFIIGIVGNASLEPLSVSRSLMEVNQESPPDIFAVGGEALEANVSESLKSPPVLREVDDFHAVPAICEAERITPCAGYCRILLILFPLFLLLLGMFVAMRRLRFTERKISRFLVVAFIHRSDGKKRACFEMEKDQNRRLKRWKLEQNIKFYPLMKRRKCSFI